MCPKEPTHSTFIRHTGASEAKSLSRTVQGLPTQLCRRVTRSWGLRGEGQLLTFCRAMVKPALYQVLHTITPIPLNPQKNPFKKVVFPLDR